MWLWGISIHVLCFSPAQLAIGNVLPLGNIPEGTAICNVEQYPGDRARMARASGNYCIVVSHNPDENLTRIRLPSGMRKILKSDCRAMIGAVAGGVLLFLKAIFHTFLTS